MKTKIKIKLSSIILILISTTIIEAGRPNIATSYFDWLSGAWKAENDSSIYFEKWVNQNDSSMAGIAYSIVNNDTVGRESITLISKDSSVFYIPTVIGQNDNKPVYFVMISNLNDKFTFENQGHDFPQRIIYEYRRPDSLIASIEGYSKGSYKQIIFKLKRITN